MEQLFSVLPVLLYSFKKWKRSPDFPIRFYQLQIIWGEYKKTHPKMGLVQIIREKVIIQVCTKN